MNDTNKLKVDRLRQAYQYLMSIGQAHKQKDIAEKMNTAASNVSNAFKGVERFLTDSFLIRFNKAFGGIFNDKWLINGEGEMLKGEEKPENNIVRITLPNMQKAAENENKRQFGGFTEKLRLLGYDEPKEDSGYKRIVVKLLDDVARNPTAIAELLTGVKQPPTLTEQMVDMITKPLVKQLREAERVIAEKEMIIAKYEAQAKKDVS